MIYLFCNQKYGCDFLATAKEFSESYKVELTIVFSGKNVRTYEHQRARKFVRSLRKWLEEIKLRYKLKIHTLIVEDVNAPSFYNQIHLADHGIVAGFNQIFKPVVIRRFNSLVNFHPSILPLYRGPVPSYWCIQNGEETTGYTLHTIDEKIDSGHILFQEEIAIGDLDSPDALDKRIAKRAAEQLRRYLAHLIAGRPWNKVQLNAAMIYKKHVDYASFPKRIED